MAEASSQARPSTATTEIAEERRLVTALFCDLVGFTPLSESLDPEEVRDLQADYFRSMAEQITRFEGTVEKYAGDAVLALFGVPTAHEDDAERAVLCALEMQAAIEPVAARARRRWHADPAIRVGINTGEVVSGTWSIGGRHDLAVTGDAVNTASRIQSAAKPGEVLVGAETMRLTRRRILYGEQRSLTLKGKAKTVPGYPALGVRTQMGERWEAHVTPLVGRDRELAHLSDMWDRARAGEGQLVSVVGDPGVGKSRLIAELVERDVAPGGGRIVRARCLSYGQEIGLWLLADLLRTTFGIAEGDAVDDVRARLTDGVMTLLTRCESEAREDALDVLGEVLGLPPGRLANAGAETRHHILTRSLRLVLAALAERVPTAIVLEDLHWIDAASQEVLSDVLAGLPGLRMLVLVAQRPGWTPPWSEWGWPERIVLRSLPEADAARLAGAALGGAQLSLELEHYLAERAGGNPFFVEELLHALRETGGLEEREGRAHLVPGAAERLPSTLTEILLARLDRLEARVRSVAQIASVIGRSFAVRLLAAVMESDPAALEMPLTALQRAEIAFPSPGSDLAYMFKHVSMREVAYNTLVQKRRQEIHLATARALAALYPGDEYVDVIAHHFMRTEEHRDAAQWLERAGDRAQALYVQESAIAYFREARARFERCGAEAGILARVDRKLGLLLDKAGQNEAAEAITRRADEEYRQAQDLEGMGFVGAELAHFDATHGDWVSAWKRLDELEALLSVRGPSPALAYVYRMRAAGLRVQGRFEEGVDAAGRAAEVARVVGDEPLWIAAEQMRGLLLCLNGEVDNGIAVTEAVAHDAERAGVLDMWAAALNNIAAFAFEAGELERARPVAERAVTVAQRIHGPGIVRTATETLAEVLLYSGKWTEAARLFHEAAARTVGFDNPRYGASVRAYLDYLGVLTGQQSDLGDLEQIVDRYVEVGWDISTTHIAARLLGEVCLLLGRVEVARDRLAPLEDAPSEMRDGFLATLARVYLECGEKERARAVTEVAIRFGQSGSKRLFRPDALTVRGTILTLDGQYDDAERDFEEALRLARSMPYPYSVARTLRDWGVMMRRRGDENGGRQKFEEASRRFKALGAARDMEWTERFLSRCETA